jgi:hypothetical protein
MEMGIAKITTERLAFVLPDNSGRARRVCPYEPKGNIMLWTIVAVLFVLWLLGFFAMHVGGGLIHILLVAAVVVFLFHMLSGRRAVK